MPEEKPLLVVICKNCSGIMQLKSIKPAKGKPALTEALYEGPGCGSTSKRMHPRG
jgi:hypothetical protein